MPALVSWARYTGSMCLFPLRPYARLSGVLEMFCEFRAQGYSAYTFCQALRAIAERKETPIYGHMCPLIMHLR